MGEKPFYEVARQDYGLNEEDCRVLNHFYKHVSDDMHVRYVTVDQLEKRLAEIKYDMTLRIGGMMRRWLRDSQTDMICTKRPIDDISYKPNYTRFL